MSWSRIKSLLFGQQQPKGRTPWTIGNADARHPYKIDADHPAARHVEGMRFSATMQLRVPLRILRRHDTNAPLDADLPDDFEPWMGMWFPRPKSLDAVLGTNGIDAKLEATRTFASPAGPVRAQDYLPFLITLREIIEDDNDSIAARMRRITLACERPGWERFVQAEGGAARINDRFFPPVLSLIPGLTAQARQGLRAAEKTTVAALNAAPDTELLAIEGIGPAKLAAIRSFCAGFDGDARTERIFDFVQ